MKRLAIMSAGLLVVGLVFINSNKESRSEPLLTIIPETFPVTVNYDLTLKEMIAAGHYDGVDSAIDEQFLENDRGVKTVVVELALLNRVSGSAKILESLEAMGYRPVTFPALLAFGAKYPNKQVKYSDVTALVGSTRHIWFGTRFGDPFLSSYNGRRRVEFIFTEFNRLPGSYFAIVRKS